MTKLLLKKSILNLRMLIVVVTSFLILLTSLFINGYIDFSNGIYGGGDLLNVYTVPFAMSSFVIFAGLFPGIPYAFSYLEERNSGYLRFIQLRMPRKKYARQKIFFTGLSGGISMLLPAIFIFIVIDLLSVDETPDNKTAIFETLVWGPWMYVAGGRLVLFFKAILMFLFGVMWSELALLISHIFRNKYVAFVMPFLIFELTWILFPIPELNPVLLIRGDFELGTPLIFMYAVYLVYIALLVIANWIMFRRRGRK